MKDMQKYTNHPNELRLEYGHWGEDRAEHVGIVHIR